MKAAVPALAVLLLASACGGGKSASDQAADNLHAAADQSDPAAAAVLDNAADAMQDAGDVGEVNATAQAALTEAGNAAAATTSAGGRASPDVQAKPHKAGEPVPSEKPGTTGQ